MHIFSIFSPRAATFLNRAKQEGFEDDESCCSSVPSRPMSSTGHDVDSRWMQHNELDDNNHFVPMAMGHEGRSAGAGAGGGGGGGGGGLAVASRRTSMRSSDWAVPRFSRVSSINEQPPDAIIAMELQKAVAQSKLV